MSRHEQRTHIYGKHVVNMAIERTPQVIRQIFLSEQFSDAKLAAKIQRQQIPTRILPPKRTPGGLPASVNHQGIIAEIDTKALLQPLPEYLKQATLQPDSLFLLLAEVQDPHNVGAMLRSAAGFGVQAVLLPVHNQAPITGAVAKVSAGMAFAMPLIQIGNVNQTLRELQERGVRAYGLAGEGSVSIYDVAWQQPTVLVVGNEATGLREKTRAGCDKLVHIPMHPRCESLNAAAAVTASLAVWRGAHAGDTTA